MPTTVQTLTGVALKAALPELARLRIEVFRDWPYIYDGSYDYEQRYVSNFAATADSIIVAASDGGRIVGAATGTPAGGHAADFAEPLVKAGYDLGKVFYFGESCLLKAYRGRGIGHAFFDKREAHARSLGRFTHVAFCGVVRHPGHALQPAGYTSLDAFWRKRGYEPVPGLVGRFAWQDIGDASETAKPMQYWMKAL